MVKDKNTNNPDEMLNFVRLLSRHLTGTTRTFCNMIRFTLHNIADGSSMDNPAKKLVSKSTVTHAKSYYLRCPGAERARKDGDSIVRVPALSRHPKKHIAMHPPNEDK